MAGLTCIRCQAPMALADATCLACGAPADSGQLAKAWLDTGRGLERGTLRSSEPGKAAADAFSKAVSLDPGLDAAHQLLIANLCRRGLGLEAVSLYKALAAEEPEQPRWQGYLKTARLGAEFQANPVKVALPEVRIHKGILARSIDWLLAPSALNLGLAGVSVLLPLGLGIYLLFKPAASAPSSAVAGPPDAGALLGQMASGVSEPWPWLSSALASAVWLAVLWYRRPKR
jgi:hypothetical protein